MDAAAPDFEEAALSPGVPRARRGASRALVLDAELAAMDAALAAGAFASPSPRCTARRARAWSA